jgi:hypothetical protein
VVESYDKSKEEDESTAGSGDEEILRVARERFALAEEAWRLVYAEGLDDLKFLSGDQWLQSDKDARTQDGRPCLTVNRLPQYTRQVVNDQKQNKQAIKVSPVDDKADIETADILQGLIRHIEESSNADLAYGRAYEGAVENSFGFFRIRTDYVSASSFDIEAIIDRIPDPFLVKFDPFFKQPDGSDANWAFVECIYSKDDYKKEFGESEVATSDDWGGLVSKYHGWLTDKSVRVCEYYCKEFEKVELAKLSNGQTIEKKDFVEGVPGEDGQPITILAEKSANIPVIHHYKINGHEILERTIFPGQFIPVIPVLGKEIIVEGRRMFESVIRHAKDTQRVLNYFVTCETELIALAPKAPFIVAEGSIPKEYEQMWKTANSKAHPFLLYKPTDLKGNPVPPPTRNVYEPPVQAITNARMQASEDLKSTTGIYDAALGARSNENSGVAIQRRSAQAQTSNFHFVDNLSHSIRHCGRILVDIIPQIYDTARASRIIGEEGEQKIVVLNELFQERGESKIYNLGVGKYDVSIDSGPSFATKRQEAVASMLELTRAYPNMVQIMGDLMLKNMDVPGSQEMAERFKKTLPPGIAEDDQQKQLPPEAQAEMAQMSQMIEALSQKLTAANEQIKLKAVETESKERIETMKIERDYKLELLKLHGQAANQMMLKELESIDRQQAALNMYVPIEEELNGGVAPDQAMPPIEQPTGGPSPGEPSMGV